MGPLLAAGIEGGTQILGGLLGGGAKKRAAKRQSKAGSKLIKQGNSAAEAALANRAAFETPQAVKDSLGLALNELGSSALQTNLERQADAALAGATGAVKRTATSGADALAALTKVYGQSQENYTSAAIAGAQERQGDLENVFQAQSQLGDYYGIQYDQNVNMPFLQRMELAQGKLAAGYNMKGGAAQAEVDSAGMFGNAVAGAGSLFASLYGGGLFNNK